MVDGNFVQVTFLTLEKEEECTLILKYQYLYVRRNYQGTNLHFVHDSGNDD